MPSKEDVHMGVIASRIAAQAGEVALGRPQALARERDISLARMALDWPAMEKNAIDPTVFCLKRAEHANEEVCAMCGEFCAVKMLRQQESGL